MADPPTQPRVRVCRVDGPTGEDAMSRSAEINVLVCPVTLRHRAPRFRVDETAYTESLTRSATTNGYNERRVEPASGLLHHDDQSCSADVGCETPDRTRRRRRRGNPGMDRSEERR